MINFSAYLYLKKGPFHFGTRAQLLLLGLSWCVLGYNEDGIQRRAVGDTVRPAGSCAGPLSDTDQDTNAEWLHAFVPRRLIHLFCCMSWARAVPVAQPLGILTGLLWALLGFPQ